MSKTSHPGSAMPSVTCLPCSTPRLPHSPHSIHTWSLMQVTRTAPEVAQMQGRLLRSDPGAAPCSALASVRLWANACGQPPSALPLSVSPSIAAGACGLPRIGLCHPLRKRTGLAPSARVPEYRRIRSRKEGTRGEEKEKCARARARWWWWWGERVDGDCRRRETSAAAPMPYPPAEERG